LLESLLGAAGGVVTRDVLLDAAWPGRSVEESNLTVQIAAIRKCLREVSGVDWIRTVPRIGYRFDGPIARAEAPAPPSLPGITRPPSAHDRSAVAVLPFRNLGGDLSETPFCEGLSEDLITDLSKISGLTVIARHSSFSYRGSNTDVRGIGAGLGVRYVVEGSVRRDGERVRINAELSETASARQVWADRFDGSLGDVFKLQDEVAKRIAAALSTAIPEGRPASSRPSSIEAYDLFVRGRTLVTESMEGNRAARPLLKSAVVMDPLFAAAHAWLGMSHCAAWAMWGERLDLHRLPARMAAERAVALDPSDADAHMILGYVHTYGGDLVRGDREFAEALSLNPNHADAWALLSDLRVFQGRAEQGVESVERAFRLNPYPPRLYFWVLGFAKYAARRYEEAIAALQHTYRTGSQRVLAASLAQLGRVEEAKAEAALILLNNPGFAVQPWAEAHPFQRPSDREHFVEGYLKAGLPLA
jgi:TolB-like protein